MILWTNIHDGSRAVSGDGHESRQKISLFRLTVTRMVVLNCTILQTLTTPRRYGDHRKVGIAYTCPIDGTWNTQTVRTILVLIDCCCRVTLHLASDNRYRLRSDRIKCVMLYTLVTDTRSNP